MAILRDIFAPSASDQEFLSQLIREITPRNVDSSCQALAELLDSSQIVLPKDVVPLLAKLTTFIETAKIEAAATISQMLAHRRRAFFTAKELNPIMAALIANPDLHQTTFAAAFLAVCAKSLSNVQQLVADPMDLAAFGALAANPMAALFLTRAAQLVPALRVKFVFDGLIEQILPTIGSNASHLALLGAVIADPLCRKYVLDMGHLRAIVDVFLSSDLNDLSTKILRVMLDPADLLHLNSVQKQLFELRLPNLLSEKIRGGNDEMVMNAALCLGDCLQYYAVSRLEFELEPFVGLLKDRPAVQTAVLYLFENLAISNPELFPDDDTFLETLEDPCTALFLSYLAYDCHHRSSLDLTRYRDLTGHALVLLLALGIQRRKYVEGADLWAQLPEDEVRRALACANVFLTGRAVLPKATLIHYASRFFADCANWTNPFVAGSQAQSAFFPQSFLAWGANLFSFPNRGRLIHATATWAIAAPAPVHDISPDQSHAQLLDMNSRTSDVLRDNDLWQARYEALERQHAGLHTKFAEVKAQLIASRCEQLVAKGD
jgi:hypothetical protein